jgi:transcriptional regulator with XRE-family HTH domain
MTLTMLREKRGLSRKALARKAGIGLATWRAIEAGGDPRLSTLEKVADALEIPLSLLVDACVLTRHAKGDPYAPRRRDPGREQ